MFFEPNIVKENIGKYIFRKAKKNGMIATRHCYLSSQSFLYAVHMLGVKIRHKSGVARSSDGTQVVNVFFPSADIFMWRDMQSGDGARRNCDDKKRQAKNKPPVCVREVGNPKKKHMPTKPPTPFQRCIRFLRHAVVLQSQMCGWDLHWHSTTY